MLIVEKLTFYLANILNFRIQAIDFRGIIL